MTADQRILVVDDYQVNQVIARKHLESVGYCVDVAVDGSQAVKAYEDNAYDLILMDIEMPILDGWESTKQIRCIESAMASADVNRIPIIAMSGHVVEDDEARYQQAGMDDCMAKPIEREILLAIVDKWLAPQKAAESSAPVSESVIEEAVKAGAGTAPMDIEKAIDEFMGDREAVERLLGDFVRKGNEQITTIEEALASSDYEQVRLEAHALKGGAANLTAYQLAESCAGMEMAATQAEPKQLPPLFKTLRNEFNRLAEYVDQTKDSAEYAG